MKLLDINKYEAHDRLEHIGAINNAGITENIESIIKSQPFGKVPFYIYVHKRTMDTYEKFLHWDTGKYKSMDEVPNTRLVWQPRLKKPEAVINSMLFKVDPQNPEEVRILWIIPPAELWGQYKEGKMTESDIVQWSIDQYINNKKELEEREADDLSDDRIAQIYRSLYPNMLKSTP